MGEEEEEAAAEGGLRGRARCDKERERVLFSFFVSSFNSIIVCKNNKKQYCYNLKKSGREGKKEGKRERKERQRERKGEEGKKREKNKRRKKNLINLSLSFSLFLSFFAFKASTARPTP